MNDPQMKALAEVMMLDVPQVPYSKESRDAVIMKTADLVNELVRRELQGREAIVNTEVPQ